MLLYYNKKKKNLQDIVFIRTNVYIGVNIIISHTGNRSGAIDFTLSL